MVKIKRRNEAKKTGTKALPTTLFDQRLIGRILPRRPVHSDPFVFRRRTKEIFIDENDKYEENPIFEE